MTLVSCSWQNRVRKKQVGSTHFCCVLLGDSTQLGGEELEFVNKVIPLFGSTFLIKSFDV